MISWKFIKDGDNRIVYSVDFREYVIHHNIYRSKFKKGK